MPPKPTTTLAIALVLTYIGENEENRLLDRKSQDRFLHKLTQKNRFSYRSPNYGNTHHDGQSLRTALANAVKKNRKTDHSASPTTAARAQSLGKNDALVDLLFRYGDDVLEEDYGESVMESLKDESLDVDEMLKGVDGKEEDEEQTEEDSDQEIVTENARNLLRASELQDKGEDEDWKPNARGRRKFKSTKAATSVWDRRKVDRSGSLGSERPPKNNGALAQQGNVKLGTNRRPSETSRSTSSLTSTGSDESLDAGVSEPKVRKRLSAAHPSTTQQEPRAHPEASEQTLTAPNKRKREGSPVAEGSAKRIKTNDALPQPPKSESDRPGAKSLSKPPRTFTSKTTNVKVHRAEDDSDGSTASLAPYPEEKTEEQLAPTLVSPQQQSALDRVDPTATTVAYLMRVVQKIPPKYQSAAGDLIQEVGGAVEGFLDKISTPIVFEPVAPELQPPR